jgi:Flp pilus assembly protein TadD
MTKRSRNLFRRKTLLVPLLLGLLAGLPTSALAAGSSSKSDETTARPKDYDKGVKLVEDGEYTKARRAFEKAARKAPTDADVLNMLAYSQRKSGQLDRAIETYQKALAIRPRFPQAREYLAEAYLQASLRELETLKSYGSEAEDESAELIRALQDAANGLPAAAQANRKPGW